MASRKNWKRSRFVTGNYVFEIGSMTGMTVLGPLLFSLYINDISADIESEIRLFADDCVCYRELRMKRIH